MSADIEAVTTAIRRRERGLYMLPCSTAVLTQVAKRLNPLEVARATIVVDGLRCSSKAQLFKHFAEVLNFPHYFGNNWDAFDECLSDVQEDRGPITLLIQDSDRLLTSSDKDFQTLLCILSAACSESRQPSMSVFFQVEPIHERSFVARLGEFKSAGIERIAL